MKYLFPPRPANAIYPSQLVHYEKRGWVAQIKKNGNCAVIFIPGDPDFPIKVYNRHEAEMKWTMPAGMTKFLRDRFQTETVLVAELLHFKTVKTKNTIYVFDILVKDGKSLEGTTWDFRQGILREMLKNPLPTNVMLAETILGNFLALFTGLQLIEDPDDEGLVLKNPNGILKDLSKPNSNQIWQVKCRRATKNYGC